MKTKATLTLLMLTFMFAIGGCDRQGPAEELGEKIDETVEDIGNDIEDACEDAKDAVGAEDKNC